LRNRGRIRTGNLRRHVVSQAFVAQNGRLTTRGVRTRPVSLRSAERAGVEPARLAALSLYSHRHSPAKVWTHPFRRWGETLSSPLCRQSRRERGEHLGVERQDAHSVRLAPLGSGLDGVSPHPKAGCVQTCFKDQVGTDK
jgi:hypothetical protein